MIKAIIFDFDGLILDTESAHFQSWQELFAQHGGELTLDMWLPHIGRSTNPLMCQLLSEQIGRALDVETLLTTHLARKTQLAQSLEIKPGVLAVMDFADQRRLSLGLASSSKADWVHGNLQRLDLLRRFKTIRTRDDVADTKPHPALYQLAVQDLDVQPHEAVALEDSQNGMKAAKAARLFCVVVPNPYQAHLDYGEADLRLESLANFPFDVLSSSTPFSS